MKLLKFFRHNKKRKITVIPYKRYWARLFKKEAKCLSHILQDELLLIAHIGSTSIPGLAAKPTIDILIGVKNIYKIDNHNQAMQKLGYIPKGEFGILNRRFFIKSSEQQRDFHVHIFETDDLELWRHINFKRYMIAHPEEIKKYAELKRKLAKQFPYDIEKYINGKKDYIAETDKKAHHWALHKTLITKRLLLRPFNMDDAPMVQQLAGDKAIADGTYYIPHPYEDGMAEQWITNHRTACEKMDQAVFAITVKENRQLIGAVGLFLNIKKLESELGYWIGKPFWGHGYATEAARAMIKYGFKEFYLRNIYSDCFRWNAASLKVIKKLGMTWKKSFEKYVPKINRFESADQYVIGAPERT
jgi:GrpB-like predicted nucleotidyltransferase (UPF0157 family)/predicted acetyltransferase